MEDVKESLADTLTMEAEFISCFEGSLQAAAFLAKNSRSGNQSKHIDIKLLALKERVKADHVIIEHTRNKDMLVNPLTKGMHPKAFSDHVPHMRLRP
ncbi:Retrovirus-related Pol polyprotein from transposon TNT 1-94 [Senna tora]|uniref:Retrovirus-related Pol polyprotein from transposon TNT 1-94 n=1 Tax=Senna tora TaxID=362788 RepID=A0A834WI67_9FABA|nr:Retrovirus-related Pol polyprotein from transposon TNT 1-94 [Senna tora]